MKTLTEIQDSLTQMEKDAARWRWWRQLFAPYSRQLTKEMIDAGTPDEIDAAIDKAIKETK